MAGDWIEPPRFNISYVEYAEKRLVELQFPPEVVERMKKMVACWNYFEKEFRIWQDVIQNLEQFRSNGSLQSPDEEKAWLASRLKDFPEYNPNGMLDSNQANRKWLLDKCNVALGAK